MFGFSSLRCSDCEYIDIKDKNKYGDAYCKKEREYVSLESYTCRYFEPSFYVMTAYCKILKIPYDSCFMNTLIDFRNSYMMNTERGKKFLEEYENIGPIIALKLETDMYRSDMVEELKVNYITPTLEFILESRLDEAEETYINMIDSLKIRYGYLPKQNEKTLIKF